MSKWKSCFFCVSDLPIRSSRHVANRDLNNFKIVLQYLLNTHENDNPLWKSFLEEEEEEWKPKVCDKCYLQMDQVRKLHLELEVIQMKLINKLDNLRKEIISSSKQDKCKEPLNLFETRSHDNRTHTLIDNFHSFQSAVAEQSKETVKVPIVYLKAYANNVEVLPLKPELVEGSENDLDSCEEAEGTQSYPVSPEITANFTEALEEPKVDLDPKPKKPRLHRRPPCPVCRKTFKSPEKMIRHHKLRHMPKEKFRHQCPHCPVKFAHLENLRTHLIREHGAEKYVCQNCGDQFDSKCAMRNHARLVHEDGGFTCEICRHVLPTRTRLKRHLISHSEEKRHLCVLCGARFKLKQGLKKHMILHENQRNHVCPTCGKGFNLSVYLEDHMRIHEDERPFVCESCGKGFKATGTLHRHKKSCQADSNRSIADNGISSNIT